MAEVQIQRTVKIGDDVVAKLAHGLMNMTWTPNPTPDETAFEAIKTSLDSVPDGVKVILNSAEFYGQAPNVNANLQLLARFFTKYPEYADKAFLAVKGGMLEDMVKPVGSPENLTRSLTKCHNILKGVKTIDLFQPARIDPAYPLEDQLKTLLKLRDQGLCRYIGLSECGEASVRKAYQIAGDEIKLVEIEISPISYEEETKKVIAACAELNIPILAYSPMGRGLLTGALKSLKDIPEGEFRHHFTRFQPENFDHNIHIAAALRKVAESKGKKDGVTYSPAQLSIAWVSARGDHIIPLPGYSDKARAIENLTAGNIVLTPEEIKEIDDIVAAMPPKGGRGRDGMEKTFMMWG